MRKIYYVYDRVADNFIYFMEAAADAVAERAFKYACQKDFAAVADDLSLVCLGQLVDGDIIPDHVLICQYKKEESNG